MTTTAYPSDAVIEKVMADRKLEKRVAAVQWLRRHNIVTVEDLAKQQADLAPLNAKLAKAAEVKRTLSDADVDRMSESEAKKLLAPKAAKRAKAEPAAKAKHNPKHGITPSQRKAGDEAMNEVRGKGAVDRKLKSSYSPKYAVYEFWGLSNGEVCHISFGETVKAHLLPEKSVTVKKWRAQLKRDAKA